jgi:hypothetical protein
LNAVAIGPAWVHSFVMHSSMNARSKFAALSLIALSFTLCSVVIIFVAGVWNTPFSTTDGAGRAMGFNDRFSAEHYAIALSRFSVQTLLSFDYAYSFVLLGMHGWGAWLILGQPLSHARRIRRFFAAQAMVFPLGWIGLFVLPWTLQCVFRGTLDREEIIDVPFIALNAHPVWLATAMIIALSLRRGSVLSTRSALVDEPGIA